MGTALLALVLSATGLLWVQAAAQAQATGDAVYQLRGRVVDGLTGKALSRALVTSRDRRLATMTDSAGRFNLTVSLPPGAAQGASGNQGVGSSAGFGSGSFARSSAGDELLLTAKKPGYLQQEQPVGLPLDATLGTTDAVLTLTPSGTVDGRVSAAGTGSPHDVQVSLLMRRVQEGSYLWTQVAAPESTDSHGEFHFGSLAPGEYTLMTTEWRGDQPRMQSSAPSKPAVTQEYPPVFLGGASGLASAVKLRVHPGEKLRVELPLHLAAYYPVSVPVTTPTPGAPVSVQFVGETVNTGFALGYDAAEGAVRGSLPSGSYTLLLGSIGRQRAFSIVPIHVQGAPLQAAPVVLAPSPRIPVRVHAEFTGKGRDSPLSLHVMLRPESGSGMFAQGGGGAGSADEFFIENARPDRYTAQAHPSSGYVSRMSRGGVDLLHDTLILNAGGTAEPIDVTVRDDGAELRGKVTVTEGALPTRSYVVLLPVDASARFSQSFAGPDGEFQLGNVPPGTYRAFALRGSANQLPYRDAGAMRAYDGKGRTFTATAGEQVNVEAPLLEDSPERMR